MIINKSNNKIIASKAKVSSSILFKAMGLMFSGNIKDFGLVFVFNSEARRSLHNFFVFFPTDILFLDKSRRIVEIKENFKPFTVYFPRKKSQYVVELPKGSVKKARCSIGDIINFK